ncbi:aspartate/glutamate racemase family protein (plasmid) [Phyllobacterium sp. 628]|uniref:aspartate/glutamate racemase family protein n=1 Tax=Phyllobacterium sp. 628 TaxID=2718938 RepID=UPI0016624F02|nr:aspartate/glutamate racemase family protein [Phyllobacterium sp. 628]QND55093.1 aspartate/glutamate racemase family protein [Phyllobacterium sp. 628]
MRILVVNPNTTASMTSLIERAAQSVAASATTIIAKTSRMGPVSIEGYYDEAFALPGLLLEISEGEAAGANAAIIACFDDTGLDAARAMATIPVIGICEAAVAMAGLIAQRFSIITTLERSIMPVKGLVHRYGMADRAVIRAADIPVLSLDDPASDALSKLRAEIEKALREDCAEAIVLGCAGMADLAHRLQNEYGVPVIDGVSAAVKLAEGLIALGLKTSKRGAYASPLPKPYVGLLAPFAPQLSKT